MRIEQIEIPHSWCEALADLQSQDPNAIIAGGALRDLFCGVEVKDVDFFTTSFPNNLSLWGTAHSTNKDYEGMQYVNAVAEYTDGGKNFNVIVIGQCSHLDLLLSFDFGICQIGFDSKQLITTPAFHWDYKNSRFTMRHIDRYPRSIKRFARISQRYTSWDIAIPQLDEANHALPHSTPVQ